MNKLLRAGIPRMKRSKVLWLCCLVLCVNTLIASFSSYDQMVKYGYEVAAEEVLFPFILLEGIALSVFISLFVGTEHNDGTIRNKLVVGHARSSIFMSNFILCALSAVLFYMIPVLVAMVLAIRLFGPIQLAGSSLVMLLVDGLLACIAYAAIFNLIAMLVTSKAHGAVAAILTAFILLFLAAWLYNALIQPETIQEITTTMAAAETDLSQVDLQEVPNPRYLTGLQRDTFQFLVDFLPSGQTAQINELEVLHPYRLALYSLLIAAGTNLAGVWLFKRKDIQ